LDEVDLAEAFELPGADLSNAELLAHVVPVQSDEFTCMSCFREEGGKKYCTECEG
jgi:hypothetical protein